MEQKQDIISKVKSMVKSLDTAARNLILYPETNEIRSQSIAAVKTMMDANLTGDGVRLFVSNGQLIFNDEIVYQDKSPEHGFVTPLFRDGVYSIEFIEGISYEEIESFLNILNKFKVLPADADDDIVTVMWEADFKFIKYDTADEYWAKDESIDIATLNVTSAADFRPSSKKSQEESNAEKPGEPESKNVESFAALFADLPEPSMSNEDMTLAAPDENALKSDNKGSDVPKTFSIKQWRKLLSFSADEKAHLHNMIEAERNRNIIADSLEILINLMYCRPDHPDNGQVLSFLVDEVREALAKADFEDVHKCVMAIMSFSQSGQKALAKLATEFSRQMATEETIKAMSQSWETSEELSENYYKDAYQFLVSLPPDSTSVMAPLLTEIKNQQIKSMLMWAIAYKMAYASIDLSSILNKLSPNLLVALINILRSPQVPFPTLMIINLVKHQTSSDVRQAAAEALIENDPGQIKILFPLIKDENAAVSKMALQYLGRYRSHQAESHLVNHLINTIDGDVRPREHVIYCYYTLGLCGTQNSLPFLEQTLFKKNLKALFGMDDDWHRQGAAIALYLLPPEIGAKALLDKAANSSFRSIRHACKDAADILARGIK